MKNWSYLFFAVCILGGFLLIQSEFNNKTIEIYELSQPPKIAVMPVKGDALTLLKVLESKKKKIKVDDTLTICGGLLVTIKEKDKNTTYYTVFGDKIHKITSDSSGAVVEDFWVESDGQTLEKLNSFLKTHLKKTV